MSKKIDIKQNTKPMIDMPNLQTNKAFKRITK